MKKKHFRFLLSILISAFLLASSQLEAKEYTYENGGVSTLMGYVSQAAQFGVRDGYDTEQDLQSAIMNFFLEGSYQPNEKIKFYGSTMLTTDWIYEIKSNDKSWKDKRFNESRDNFFVDDESWQLLKEAHVTWTPGNFIFRAGKQIVSWGEMDFSRVLDQINPVYDARGFADVEFETSIIPIWLLRADYWPDFGSSGGALQDAGIQFIFNPNAQFIPYQGLKIGNENGGIWAPEVILDTEGVDAGLIGYPWIPGQPSLGEKYRYREEVKIEDLDEWDSDNFEYGLKLNGTIGNHILSLVGFTGRQNVPQATYSGNYLKLIDDPYYGLGYIPEIKYDSDGMGSMTYTLDGKYFRQKYTGMIYNYDLSFLTVSSLGGVSPILRIEAMYEFGHTFVNDNANQFTEADWWKNGIALDWKVKINALNETSYFTIMPQFFYNRIIDYKSDWALTDAGAGIEKNMYALGVSLETAYLNARLKPSLALLHDYNGDVTYYFPALTWKRNYEWSYSLTGLIVDDHESNAFDHKNYVGIKATYTF